MNPNEQIDRMSKTGGMVECPSKTRVYLKKARAHHVRTCVRLALRKEAFEQADVDPKYHGYLS